MAEIDDQLNGIATYNSITSNVTNNVFIEAPFIVKESSSFDCQNFITRMRRDYGSKILYDTSTKKGKTTIHDAHIVPTITFRDHEEMHFGEKLNVNASGNIINDAGRIFADAMYFEAGGDMRNTGQLCFVDSLKANINGNFSNDIIVLTEYEEVHGVSGGRTFTGNAARNAIKAHSGEIIAIAERKGFRDLKEDKLLTKAEVAKLTKDGAAKRIKLHTYTGHEARHIIKKNPDSILAMGDGKHFHDVKTGALLTKKEEVETKGKGLLDIKAGKDFNHLGIIDVNDVKIVANGNLNVENLPDQFIVKWDPGAKAKQGMDCFSIASAFTPSEIRARDGSVKLVVGGDAKIYASLLAAADDIIVEAKGRIEAKAKGASYLGNVSIENGRRNRTVRQESDIIIQKVQLVANGNVRMIAYKNVEIEGGDIVAALEVELVGDNIKLTPIQIVAENKVKEYGSRGFSYYKNNMTYSTANVATTDIRANNIKLSAKNNVNIKASMLMAMEDLVIEAGNNINVVEELVEHYVRSSHFGAHLNFFGKRAMDRVLKKDMRGATRAFAQEFGVLSQLNRLIKAKHGADVAIEGVKSILDLYKEYQAIDKMGFPNYCKKAAVEKVLSASASAEWSQEKQQWFEAILPVMRAKNILMKAGNNINLRGLQAEAGTMDLEAGNNITIEAAQEHYDHKDKERTIGVHANAVFDPTKDEFGLNVGVSGGYGSSSTHKVTQENAHLNVGNFKAKAGDKFKMAGAVINTENADIEANQLLMESLLDTESG
ncbi:MAG: hemagglutinin repeat-containing protein, partial [Alphaproteobacteria bacterium]|nr:hemagglutinin repeat-containing protein [Alphaproteobacteria bacterium]